MRCSRVFDLITFCRSHERSHSASNNVLGLQPRSIRDCKAVREPQRRVGCFVLARVSNNSAALSLGLHWRISFASVLNSAQCWQATYAVFQTQHRSRAYPESDRSFANTSVCQYSRLNALSPSRGHDDFASDTDVLQASNRPPGRIDFPPPPASFRHFGVCVVIVVPTFAVGE